jgi:hypothetical protein
MTNELRAQCQNDTMSDRTESELIQRTLDTDRENPSSEVAEIVAELDDREIEALTPTWKHLDDILEHVFSSPPQPEAQVEITLSYEGYRISIEQNGRATFSEV